MLRWALALVLGLAGVVLLVLIALRQPGVATWLANAVLSRLSPLPRASARVDRVHGDWTGWIELDGLTVARGDTLLARADTLRARYRLGQLFAGRLDVTEVAVLGVRVTADARDTTKGETKGRPLTFAEILQGRFYSGLPVRVERLRLEDAAIGGHSWAPDTGFRITSLVVHASDIRLGRGFAFRLDTLAASIFPAGHERAPAALALSCALASGRAELGRLRFRSAGSDVEGHGSLAIGARDTLQQAGLSLHARPLVLGDLAGFVPGLPLEGTLVAEVDLDGTRTDRLSGKVEATLEHGRLGALEPGPVKLAATLQQGEMVADARARLEQANVTLHATGAPLAVEPRYAIALRADRLPASLPGLPWWSGLAERSGASLTCDVNGVGYANAALEVAARAHGDVGDLALAGTARFGRVLEWEVRELTFVHLDPARLAGSGPPGSVSGSLSASGTVPGGGAPRASATLRIAPSAYGDIHVRGADANVTLDRGTLGGQVHVDSDAGALDVGSFAMSLDPGGGSHVRDTRFHDVDLSRVLSQPQLATRLNGTLAVEARDLRDLGARAPRAAFDAGPSAEARLSLAPSTFRGEPVSSGSIRLTLAHGAAHATAALDAAAGSLDLDAQARPFDTPMSARIGSLRFHGVDLAAWTGVTSLRSQLAGTLTGDGHAAAGDATPARWAALLELSRSRVGDARLDGGRLEASLAAEHAHVEGTIGTAGDALAVRGDVSLRDHGANGTAAVTVPLRLLAAVAGLDSLPSRGALVADARFTAAPSAPLTFEGNVRGSGSVGRTRLDSLAAAFRLEPGLLRVDTLLARSNVGTVRGGGGVALDPTSGARRSDLHLRVETADVSPLRELLRTDTLALASGVLDVTLAGSDSVRTLAAHGELRSLVYEGFRLSGAQLTADGTLSRAWRPIDATAAATLRQVQGLPIPVRDAHAQVRLQGSRAAFTLAAASDARASVRVVGRAGTDSTGGVVTLDSLAVRTDTLDWRLARPTRIAWTATRYSVDDLDVASRGGRLTARGAIDRLGEQDLDVTLQHVGLPGLATWIGRRDLSGHLDGRLVLRGPATAPRAEGQATLAMFTGGYPAGSVGTRLSWADRRLQIDGRLASAGEDSLSWTARLPFAASLAPAKPDHTAPGGAPPAKPAFAGEVNIRVLARHFPLAALAPFLDPTAVGEPSGTLDVDATLSGDERALAGRGHLEIDGGVVPLPALRVRYSAINLRAEFEGDRLIVRSAGVTSGKGTLATTGDVRFVSVARVEPRLHVKCTKFVFADSPDLKAMASSELDISGTLDAPVVKGSVTVGNSSLYFTQPDLTAGAGDVQLTPADVRMMEETFGYVAPRAPALPVTLYDASDLDLAIKMERDNWIRQRVPPKMAVALTGDFKLRKRPHGEPELFGKIEPVPNRGYVQQFARSFDIIGGEVLLNGKMKDHAVSIHAQYKPQTGVESENSTDVVVKLDVEGTPDHLKLTLSSEPAMSEAEIVNYIATGRSTVAAPSTTTSSSNASLMRDIGLSALTGPAESAAQEAVGLDVLEVRYDPLRGATLVAGRYVDPQLYVGFRSPLDYSQNTSTNTSNSTVNSTAFEVEYAISRWLVVTLQGETAKVRSFIRARRAY